MSTAEVIRQPYVAPVNNGATSEVFVGWDIDGDGVADMIPATTSVDISARAVMKTVENKYTVNFFDLDRTTVLYSYIVAHGDTLELPTPTKTGYSFDGWSGYYGGEITSNISVYSSWTHDGDGHNYVKTIHVPTCTENGYDEYICSICGNSYYENYTDPIWHTFGEWVVDVEPECEEDGVKYHICELCGTREYDSIPALGHEFERKPISRATCTEQGEVECVCLKCGETYVEHIAVILHDRKRIAKKQRERHM